jgi:hypothetical protein
LLLCRREGIDDALFAGAPERIACGAADAHVEAGAVVSGGLAHAEGGQKRIGGHDGCAFGGALLAYGFEGLSAAAGATFGGEVSGLRGEAFRGGLGGVTDRYGHPVGGQVGFFVGGDEGGALGFEIRGGGGVAAAGVFRRIAEGPAVRVRRGGSGVDAANDFTVMRFGGWRWSEGRDGTNQTDGVKPDAGATVEANGDLAGRTGFFALAYSAEGGSYGYLKYWREAMRNSEGNLVGSTVG